jgi:Siphovirus Gp157
MTGLRLYEIANQFRALEDAELTDDIPQEVIRNTLEGLEGDFNEKAIACAKFILNLEATAAAVEEAAAAMKARAVRIQRRADNVRAYLLFNLQAIDKKRIDCADFVIRRAVNPPAVQVTDEAGIPAQYWWQPEPPPPRIDKKAVKEALQSGIAVPGAYLESGERVDIRL